MAEPLDWVTAAKDNNSGKPHKKTESFDSVFYDNHDVIIGIVVGSKVKRLLPYFATMLTLIVCS